MPKNTIIQFEKRYREALHLHLCETSRRRRNPGLPIAEDAESLGFDRLDLVHAHESAMKTLVVSPSAASGVFLRSALKSFARPSGASSDAAGNPLMPATGVDARIAALASAREELLQEISLRLATEKKLVESTRHYNELLAQSKRMQLQAKRLAQRVLLAQEAERKEISRDLHYEVAQTLAGINVQLAALKEASAVGSAELRKRIARTQLLVARSLRIVHRYARELRPALLDDLGLIPALRAYIRDLPECHGLNVSFKAYPEVKSLDNKRSTVIFRVVQEGLTNICRHAQAHFVTVSIMAEDDVVRLAGC